MGPRLGNGFSPCFFAFLRGGIWQAIPKSLFFFFGENFLLLVCICMWHMCHVCACMCVHECMSVWVNAAFECACMNVWVMGSVGFPAHPTDLLLFRYSLHQSLRDVLVCHLLQHILCKRKWQYITWPWKQTPAIWSRSKVHVSGNVCANTDPPYLSSCSLCTPACKHW